MTNVTGIGIDVAKATLAIALRSRDGKVALLAIKNERAPLKALAKEWHGYTEKIVLESTGTYQLLAATILAQAGLDVRVINPLLTKKYQTASIRKVKSDPTDAMMLAEMAEREQNLPKSFQADAVHLKARQSIGLLQNIEKELQSLVGMERAASELSGQLQLSAHPAKKQIAAAIEQLKLAKKKLQEAIMADESKKEMQALLQTIPGVSAFVSALITIFFDASLESSKSWVAFAGLDISVRQSGTFRGHGKLTKRGNGYLRKRFFSAAWGATMHDTKFRSEYDALRTKGRAHHEALVILARKILRISHAISHSNQPYHAI